MNVICGDGTSVSDFIRNVNIPFVTWIGPSDKKRKQKRRNKDSYSSFKELFRKKSRER
jgi:hypothetical protein